MSDCDEILQELYRFLDGELDGAHRHHVEAHLDGCLDCLQAFDFHAELRVVIARKCADPIPPALLARLAQCLRDADGDVGRPEPDR